MTEVTNELMYEVLKAIRARLSNMEEGHRELRGQFSAMRVNMSGLQTQISAVQHDIGNVYETLGAIDGRMVRIERRLEIIDTPAE
jgi:DNA repair ATPase RecN